MTFFVKILKNIDINQVDDKSDKNNEDQPTKLKQYKQMFEEGLIDEEELGILKKSY